MDFSEAVVEPLLFLLGGLMVQQKQAFRPLVTMGLPLASQLQGQRTFSQTLSVLLQVYGGQGDMTSLYWLMSYSLWWEKGVSSEFELQK